MIVDLMEVNECDYLGTYLNLPFYKGKSQPKTFSGIMDKICNKLAQKAEYYPKQEYQLKSMLQV